MHHTIRFEIFSLFPEVLAPYLQASILLRAQTSGLVSFKLHNIRDWAVDKHQVTDDEPYGGGGGMVMKPEPIFAALENVLGDPLSCPVILLTPQPVHQVLQKALIQARLGGPGHSPPPHFHLGDLVGPPDLDLLLIGRGGTVVVLGNSLHHAVEVAFCAGVP